MPLDKSENYMKLTDDYSQPKNIQPRPSTPNKISANFKDSLNRSDKILKIVENSRKLKTNSGKLKKNFEENFIEGLKKVSDFRSGVHKLKSEYTDFVNKLNNAYTNDFEKGIDLISSFGLEYEKNEKDGKKIKSRGKSKRKSKTKSKLKSKRKSKRKL